MEWLTSWSYVDTDFSMFPIYAENETQRMWYRNNIDSSALRIKASNKYNRYPITVNRITVACSDEDGRVASDGCTLQFDGCDSVTLGPGEVRYSDVCSFNAKAGSWIAISLYVKERTKITAATSSQSNIVTRIAAQEGGDFCDSEYVSGERFIDEAREFIALKPLYNVVCCIVSSVEVYTDQPVSSIALIGDSITQHGNWGEALTARLYDAYPGKVTVFNRGICGNKILHDASIRTGFGMYFGINALERFEDDVFGDNRVDTVILQEGVNDIINPADGMCPSYETIESDDLIAGYRRLIEIAKRHGARIFGCTIMPFKGFREVWNPDNENKRNDVNSVLRSGALGFDGLFDFDSVLADSSDKTRMTEKLTADHLHPNKEGGRKLAESICLDNLITKRSC